MRSGSGLAGGIGWTIGAFSDSIAAASRLMFGVGFVRWVLDFVIGFDTEERRRARSEVGGRALTPGSDSRSKSSQSALMLLLSFLSSLAMLEIVLIQNAILFERLSLSSLSIYNVAVFERICQSQLTHWLQRPWNSATARYQSRHRTRCKTAFTHDSLKPLVALRAA